MHNHQKVIKTTVDSRTYWLATLYSTRCYDRNELHPKKRYSQFRYRHNGELTGKFPNWKLCTKNHKQWQKKNLTWTQDGQPERWWMDIEDYRDDWDITW